MPAVSQCLKKKKVKEYSASAAKFFAWELILNRPGLNTIKLVGLTTDVGCTAG